MHNMKIGVIAHIKHPIRSPFSGGLEAFTYDICRQLMQKGHQITLFASSKSDESLNVYSILDDTYYNDETGFREKRPNVSSEYMAEHHAYMDLMQHIDTLNLDIIFNNSLHYVPITMAGMLETPMLTVLHTPPFFELQNAVKLAESRSDMKYITVSAKNAANWSDYTANCDVIPNGINLQLWEYHPEAKGDYVIWFGRIHPDKGTHLALQAAKMAGVKLQIVGTIADEKYYNEQVAPLLNEQIICAGHKNQEELNNLIGNAILSLITPVWEEPFGLVVAESLACGTPVAGFATGALPLLITEETGVLVAPGDAKALAQAIEKARLKNRASCRRHAEASFDADNMVQQYEEQLSQWAKLSPVHQSDIDHL